MKKLFLYLPLLLALVLGTAGCSDDEEKNVIQPIDVADSSISAFFSTEWPEPHKSFGGSGGTTSFFYDSDTYGGVHIYENLVCVINSRQELADIYQGKKELPEIDFDKYTLILGQQVMGYVGFYVARKELLAGEDGSLILNLYARNNARSDENMTPVLQILSFWGLYPKQAKKNISVNVIQEFPNRE